MSEVHFIFFKFGFALNTILFAFLIFFERIFLSLIKQGNPVAMLL